MTDNSLPNRSGSATGLRILRSKDHPGSSPGSRTNDLAQVAPGRGPVRSGNGSGMFAFGVIHRDGSSSFVIRTGIGWVVA